MEHYYSKKPTSDPDLHKIHVTVEGLAYDLFSGSSIFSKERLDKGSSLLISSALVPPGSRILDLGCGLGVVGISMKMLHPDSEVVMSDVNSRAVEIARKNIRLHNLEGISAVESDVFSSIPDRFDVILLNPPQTAGKDLCFRMIEESKDHLAGDGTLQLVARPNKGGKTLAAWMEEVFGNVAETGKGSGFKVYLSKKE